MLHGTIFGTLFYLASLLACTVTLYWFRKSHKPMNGFIWAVLSFLSVLCMGSIIAGVISILRIPVNLYTMAAAYFLVTVLIAALIRKDGMRQEYVWEKYDVFVIVLVTAVVAAISIKIFSPQLVYCYYNSDAGGGLLFSLVGDAVFCRDDPAVCKDKGDANLFLSFNCRLFYGISVFELLLFVWLLGGRKYVRRLPCHGA